MTAASSSFPQVGMEWSQGIAHEFRLHTLCLWGWEMSHAVSQWKCVVQGVGQFVICGSLCQD